MVRSTYARLSWVVGDLWDRVRGHEQKSLAGPGGGRTTDAQWRAINEGLRRERRHSRVEH